VHHGENALMLRIADLSNDHPCVTLGVRGGNDCGG